MNNNNKDKQLHIRVNDDELSMISRQAEKAGMSKSAYILSLVEREEKAEMLGAPKENEETIHVYKETDIRALIYHMAKWGNNLNQATSALNNLCKSHYASDAKALEILTKVLKYVTYIAKAVNSERKIVYELMAQKHIVLKDRSR